MLNIGQRIFTVCGLQIAPQESPYRYRIYISEKEINGIRRQNNGDIVYTAGKHDELHFHESEPGKYRSIANHNKLVFLTNDEAEKEKSFRISKELERRKQVNGITG
jgi:hypothetical protein